MVTRVTDSETFSLNNAQVKVSLGGQIRYDEDGNAAGGRSVEMVVEGNEVFMVSF